MFLQNLRCEDIHRPSLVFLESCKQEQKKLDSLQNGYERLLENLRFSEKITLSEYVEQAQKTAFAEQQEAYLQGMFDTFQILCWLGMFSTNEKVKSIIEKVKNDSSK